MNERNLVSRESLDAIPKDMLGDLDRAKFHQAEQDALSNVIVGVAKHQ